MQVELACRHCSCCFAAPSEMSCDYIWEQMTCEGPVYAWGEGETFEDMIFTSFSDREVACPDCGELASVSEESLGKMAMELLAQW